ncbi:MAG: DoxX family protein [Myxococcota bacterium]|jgi:putative oxidoreductase|nr:DoxX family protein [Myxococcota bacterium]
MKPFLFGGQVSGPVVSQIGLAVIRVVAGLSLAFAHGLGKLPPPDGFVSLVDKLGLPLPSLFAWAAGLSEFVGGLLLAVGLMTRPAAMLIAATMGVAVFGYHSGDPWAKIELAALYGGIAICFACTGSGRFGLDRVVNRM